ncbi:hypothetical protein TK45_06435 [Bowmanella sp. JS7-9]|nr:hypothetical protein TK45_06435 [Bowmanella sp. JS7-9]
MTSGALITVLMTPLWAEEIADIYSLSLADLLNVKIESNTLTEKTIRDIPAPATIFTRTEIDALGVRYLHELLEFVPGYQVSRYSTYPYEYSASSRGLSDGSSSKKILFLLDGHAINAPRSGNVAHLANFSLQHVERVEILRGPGSSIYGSNAFTGVVNIVSRKDISAASLSSGNRLDYDLFAAHSFQDTLNLTIQANIADARGEPYLVADSYSNQRVTTSDPFKQHSLHVALEGEHSRIEWHTRELQMADFYHTSRISNQYNRSLQKAQFLFAEHEFQLTEQIQSTLLMDWVETEIHNGNQSTAPGLFATISQPASDEPLHGVGIFEDRRIALNWQNNWSYSPQTNVQFGLEWQQNSELRAEGYTNFDLVSLLSRDYPIQYFPNTDSVSKIGTEGSQRFMGAYTQIQTHAMGVDWILGGRYDRYQGLSGQFNLRLGAIFYPTDAWQLKLLYGEAFRAPEISETGLIRGITRAGNPYLISESINTTDIILQYLGDDLLLSVGAFYNHYTHPIIVGDVDGLVSFVNGTQQSSQGLETELHWQLNNQTRLRVTATHFFKLPTAAFRESDSMASIQLTNQWQRWQTSLSAVYRAERETEALNNDLTTLDAYWLWRARIAYQMNKDWSLALNIDNIANTDYRSPSISAEIPDGVPNKRRNWTLSLNWAF